MKDTDILKGIHKRTTKMIPNLRNLSYEERLKRLDMFSLRCKRDRGDLIKMFNLRKLLKNEDRRIRKYIILLNKDKNPTTAGSARINAKEREKKERKGKRSRHRG